LELFKFSSGFDANIPNSCYREEYESVRQFLLKLKQEKKLSKQTEEIIRFSARELETLSLVSNGYSYKEASRKLEISQRTIEFHINNMKKKISARTKIDLIAFYKNYF
jgi:DNA-binding NarL/FixJ family response regulator